jgi:hypothetical protein
MIPTYNCAGYLRQTLASVLAQDPGPGQMQIEVVDDCSTKDDPASVVEEVGKGRVAFYKKWHNEGAVANFNTCIERSRGHLVHILHGDDYVHAGFYAEVERLADSYPNLSLYATRAFFVDEEDVICSVSQRVERLERPSNDPRPFFYETPFQCAGVVVRRCFYERHGGFLSQLVHTADCEMWCRATVRGGGILWPHPLAFYRCFELNDSGRLARMGENVRDILRLNQVLAARHAEFDMPAGLRRASGLAFSQAERFQRTGNQDAAKANMRLWRQTSTVSDRTKYVVRRFLRALRRASLVDKTTDNPRVWSRLWVSGILRRGYRHRGAPRG